MNNDDGQQEKMGVLGRNADVPDIIRGVKSGRLPKTSIPKNLKRVSLVSEDLSGMDFSNVDLSESDLTNADLRGSKLFRASLRGAVLLCADLTNADLTGADLTGANMENAKVSQAGMGMACLSGARLFQANLKDASLIKADFSNADLRCTNLSGALIRESNLSSADLTGADLRAVDMSLSKVHDATFRNADMRQARLRVVDGFEYADWIGVDIRDINFAGAYRLRRFVVDQNYLKEFRERNSFSKVLYFIWWLTSDCGRSLARWCACIALQVFAFAGLYFLIGLDYGKYPTFLSPIYYSVVTMTTLGYGDVVPLSWLGQFVSMIEVMTGYIMLGGLLSIFSMKMARRGD